MFIRQQNQDFTAPAEIARFCDPLGIERDIWDIGAIDPAVYRRAAPESVEEDACQQQILDVIQAPLSALKAKNGYLTEDIVCLSPEKPNLETLLRMFEQEHHHTDDEVRAILYGEGIFGIVPPPALNLDGPFEIHLQAGDLIVVPAYTRHWFTLTPLREIVALRIFKTSAGWEAIYPMPDLQKT